MSGQTVGYILKRLALAVFTVFVVITVTFFVMHAVPGGPFLSEKAISPEAIEALEKKYGMDKPVFTQYLTYLFDVVAKLDFGPSLKQRGRLVSELILDGLQVSARLGLMAAAAAILIGLLLGSYAALRRNGLVDKVIMVVTTAFVSMPSFIMGTLLLLIFAVHWMLVPANGAMAGGQILPVVTLALYPTAYITRLTRSSMLDVLHQDFIRTAKAKGVARSRMIFKHALKNAVTPVITYLGPMIANIVTGSLVVERIFAVPGIGRTFVSSIMDRDYPVIMGTTIVLAVLVVIMNLLSDLLYKAVDPRIKLQ